MYGWRGRMGLLVAQVLRTVAPDVTVFGRHNSKLAVARTLGLAIAQPADPASRRFDIVVDVTGRPEGLTRALELCELMATKGPLALAYAKERIAFGKR